jgi:hypothetical protein
MKFVNENIYWHGTGQVSDFLNRPAIIVTILFFEVNIFPLLDELP